MRELLRNDGFRRLWISQVALTLGDAMMQMGLLELFRKHGYDIKTETAKMLFAVALPGLVFGPLAIAYLDRWQRRTVLAVSDTVRAVMVAGIAVWLLPLTNGHIEERGLFIVYSMIFVIGAVTTFYYPARYALMPHLVPTEKLVQANTLFTTTLAVAAVVGRPLGGIIAEVFGVQWAVLANALAYAGGAALIWSIRMERHATTKDDAAKPPGGWNDLKEGLTYLWHHPVAMQLTVLAGVFAFLGGVFIVAFTAYSYETLKLGTAGVGYLAAAAGPGAAVGFGLLARGGKWTKSAWLPPFQLVLAGGILLLLSITSNPWLAAPMLTVLGAVVATAFIPLDSKLQEQVTEQRRGAVFAARGMWTSLTTLVAFWLQFGTKLFKETPATTLLLWLGIGAGIAAILSFVVTRTKSRP
jgi:MFS family permease